MPTVADDAHLGAVRSVEYASRTITFISSPRPTPGGRSRADSAASPSAWQRPSTSRSAAGDAFIRYLASPQAAAIWAAAGGFISPNINLGLSVYPDAISRSIAASLLQAGDDFRFSLSDLTPAGFGGTEGRGMRKILRQFLVSRDVSGASLELEQAAGKAYPP